MCVNVPYTYFSPQVTTSTLVAGNIFATQAAAVGTAVGGLVLAIPVNGVCGAGTVGCVSG